MEEAKMSKENTVITVKYSGVNIHGKLIKPIYFRRKLDCNWSTLLFNFNNENKT